MDAENVDHACRPTCTLQQGVFHLPKVKLPYSEELFFH